MFSASDITAIVVSYNSVAVLPACLAALAAEGVEVIVVDNASADSSIAVARAAGVQVIASPRNEGYGRGNHLGIEAASTPLIMVCNPDLTLAPGSIAAMLEAFAAYPEAGLIAPLIVEPGGRLFIQPRSLLSPRHLNQARKPLVPEGPASIPFVSGACFVMERQLYLAIGGFDPNIFLFYEDDDLCRRLMDKGRAAVLVPAARVHHERGQSSQVVKGLKFRTRWHGMWSNHYVRAKFGLGQPGWGRLLFSMAKAGLSAMLGRRSKFERHAGSVAGALAYRRGDTALDREGLS